MDLSKVINFLKNPSPPKKKLNKIGFMHNYEIIHTYGKTTGPFAASYISATACESSKKSQKSRSTKKGLIKICSFSSEFI